MVLGAACGTVDERIYGLEIVCEDKVDKLQEEKAEYEARLADLTTKATELADRTEI